MNGTFFAPAEGGVVKKKKKVRIPRESCCRGDVTCIDFFSPRTAWPPLPLPHRTSAERGGRLNASGWSTGWAEGVGGWGVGLGGGFGGTQPSSIELFENPEKLDLHANLNE